MKLIAFQDFIRRYYSGGEFILFDTETTGLNTFHDDILEVAASIWDKNGLQTSFQELVYVNPNKISPEAWKVHQIPREEIEKARLPEAVFKDFLDFCGNRPLVAHNIKFDFPMLNSNLIRNGFTPYQNDEVACSLIYAKEKMQPGKLSELARYYGLATDQKELHRALYDVEVLAHILQKMMADHEPQEMQYSLLF